MPVTRRERSVVNASFPGPKRPWVIHGAFVGLGSPLVAYTAVLLIATFVTGFESYSLALLLALTSGVFVMLGSVPLGIAAALFWRFAVTRLSQPDFSNNWAVLATYFAAVYGVATLLSTRRGGTAVVAMVVAFLTSASWTALRRSRPIPLASSDASATTPAGEGTVRPVGYTRGRAMAGWAMRGLVVAVPMGVVTAVPNFAMGFFMGGPVVLLPMLMVSVMRWIPLAVTLMIAGAVFGLLLSLDDRPVVNLPPISGLYFGVVGFVLTLLQAPSVQFGWGVTLGLVCFAVGWLVALRYRRWAGNGTAPLRFSSED